MDKYEMAKEMVRQIQDLFEGNENNSDFGHMTGDIELCGKTADDVLRQINDERGKEGR